MLSWMTRSLCTLLIVLILASSWGPAIAQQPQTEICKGITIVKGTLVPIVSYGFLYLAEKKGFFKKYCIENQIEKVGLNVSFPLVAAGKYDWGRSSNGPGLYNAINEGLDIVGVVDRLTYKCSGDNALVISTKAAKEGVRNVKDLKGRTLAIFARGSLSELWLAKLLEKNGMTEKDIKLAILGWPDMVSALSTGRIDGAFLTEPLLTKLLMKGEGVILVDMGREYSGMNIGMMMFGKRFLEKENGNLAVRWIAAYLEGVRYAQDPANRNEVIEATAKSTDVEPEVVAKIYDNKITWPQVDPNGYVDVDKMLKYEGSYFLKTGAIKKLPEPTKIFDPTYLERALKIVGKVPPEKYQLCNRP